MDISRWEASCRYIADSIYGDELDQRDAIVDAMFSPDATLEQLYFHVQGKSSIKNMLNLYRIFNKGKGTIESVNFNSTNKTFVVIFNQEFELRMASSSNFQYPAFTIFHLVEVEEERWMIHQVKDVVDPKNFISVMPLVGTLYNSFVRPLAGSVLATAAGYYDSATVQKTYIGKDSSMARVAAASEEKRDEFPAQTLNYLNSIEKVSHGTSDTSST